MTQSTTDRAALIKKLLHKAEANGTTPEEREAFNAKAAQLMVQWGIDDALLAAADTQRLATEQIVQREFTTDSPKSYSFEMATVGVRVAEALSCRGLLQRKRDGRTNTLVIGFEADVERVGVLFQSLAVQCTFELGPWFRAWARSAPPWINGTDRFNAKRSFIRGYANGIEQKMRAAQQAAVAESKPGTDLVLVDRKARVTQYVDEQMKVGTSRTRSYHQDGSSAGHAAGLRADVGGGKLSGSRTQIGG